MTTAHHSRVRLVHRHAHRRPACLSGPTSLTLYAGLREPGGAWTLYAGGSVLAVSDEPRALAAVMLADAFPGRSIRRDLVDAFVAAWDPPDGGFVLPADLVMGWSLRWALEHPT